MYNVFKTFPATPSRLFVSSFVVFLILNLFENLLHYSIGRDSDQNKLTVKLPTHTDWVRMILVMVVFAILQGVLTCWMNGCLNASK